MPTNFRESGFIDAVDGETKLRRLLGRARAGTTGLGRQGRRRLAKGYDRAHRARVEDAQRSMHRMMLTNAQLYEAAIDGLRGAREFGNMLLDDFAIEAIITALIRRGGYYELQKLYDGNVYWRGLYCHESDMLPYFYTDRYEFIWRRAVAASGDQSALLKRLPYMVHGSGDLVMERLYGGELAELHPSAAWMLGKVIDNPRTIHCHAKLLQALVQVGQSAAKRGSIPSQILEVFLANADKFGDIKLTVPPYVDMTGEDFIRTFILVGDGAAYIQAVPA